VLSVGTLEPRKNLETLFEAVRRLHERGTRVGLVIAGRPGWRWRDPRREERFASLAPFTHVLRDVPDDELPGLYAGAAAVACPSWTEGFGLAGARGAGPAACGRGLGPRPRRRPACPTSRCACRRTRPTSWPTPCHRALHDDALRRRVAERAPQVAQDYSWDRTARATLEVYRRVAAGSPRRSGERRRGPHWRSPDAGGVAPSARAGRGAGRQGVPGPLPQLGAGVVWSLLNPICFALVLYAAFRPVLHTPSKGYVAFSAGRPVSLAMVREHDGELAGDLPDHATLVKRTALPRMLLPVATAANHLVHFIVALCVALPALILTGHQPAAIWLFGIPLLLLLQSVLCLGLSLALSTLNVVFPRPRAPDAGRAAADVLHDADGLTPRSSCPSAFDPSSRSTRCITSCRCGGTWCSTAGSTGRRSPARPSARPRRCSLGWVRAPPLEARLAEGV
jgi:hypothetical protein